MEKEYTAYYKSPIGIVEIKGNDEGISRLHFIDDKDMEANQTHPMLEECIKQLDEYFNGIRKEFTVKLKIQGTEFQKNVWGELCRVPYGKIASYRDIAQSVGNQKAVRAVGSANGKNKIYIIVPCHRVVGSDGKLTGYAGGLWRKEWLLEHEKRNPAPGVEGE